MGKQPDDPVATFVKTMRLFCVTPHLLNEWAASNRDEIRDKLTDEQQERLRQEFKEWRDRLTRSS